MGVIGWLTGKNVAFYPGCLTRNMFKDKVENYMKIFSKLNIGCILIDSDICCGAVMLDAGYEKEARKVMKENFEMFRKKGIGKIITNCPHCFNTFNVDYPKMFPEWNLEVEHVTQSILKKLRQNPRLINIPMQENIIYHDPCYLGRHSNIYQEPRKVLESLGYNVAELQNNNENALCCGAGGNLKINEPAMSNKIAKEMIIQAKKTNTEKIVSPCPLCFSQFKELSDFEVLEFSDAVIHALTKNKI